MPETNMISELLVERLNYCIYVVLLLIGLWAMLAKRNLIKKLIGMSIFQTAIILFYVSIAVKDEATIPIYLPEHDPHGNHAELPDDAEVSESGKFQHRPVILDREAAKKYSNPLPHVLMLTAIVVGVATLGLALALCQRIYRGYGTIEEDVLLDKLERVDERASISPIEKRRQNARRRRSRQKAKAKSITQSVSRSSSKESKTTGKSSSSKPKPKRKPVAKGKKPVNKPSVKSKPESVKSKK
jgi:multicomponent Na+:H+ antiporter subunit C